VGGRAGEEGWVDVLAQAVVVVVPVLGQGACRDVRLYGHVVQEVVLGVQVQVVVQVDEGLVEHVDDETLLAMESGDAGGGLVVAAMWADVVDYLLTVMGGFYSDGDGGSSAIAEGEGVVVAAHPAGGDETLRAEVEASGALDGYDAIVVVENGIMGERVAAAVPLQLAGGGESDGRVDGWHKLWLQLRASIAEDLVFEGGCVQGIDDAALGTLPDLWTDIVVIKV